MLVGYGHPESGAFSLSYRTEFVFNKRPHYFVDKTMLSVFLNERIHQAEYYNY